jgi:hypothetical protein
VRLLATLLLARICREDVGPVSLVDPAVARLEVVAGAEMIKGVRGWMNFLLKAARRKGRLTLPDVLSLAMDAGGY